jgi:isopenicillin-N N-acyltransferase-like protein
MLPVIEVAGGASIARGTELGRATAAQVEHSLTTYRSLLPAITGRSWPELIALAHPMISAVRPFDAPLVDELVGIAAGSNVSFDDIAVVSARSELLQLAPSSPVGECTLIVNDGRIGQTWDWFIGQLAASIVWRTPRFVAFAEAGMPPKIGVNSNGVAVTLTFLRTRLSVEPAGVPVHAMLHHLLEHATSTADAVHRLLSVRAAGCAAIGVLDPSGAAAVIELGPHGRTSLATAAQPFAHTNHCLAPSLVGLDTPGLLLDNSAARLTRARMLIDGGAGIEDVLSDDVGPHPIALEAGGDLGTVVAVVVDVHARALHIAPGNPARVAFSQTIALSAERAL